MNGDFDVALEEAHRRCVRVCEQQNVGTVRGTEGTGEFERYTPKEYIEAARQALGGIDLDPATSEEAQKVVQAERYFTAADDGLSRDWDGKVFLNPPYHRDLAPKFIDKLIIEREAKRTTAAVLLTNNCTDTEWFAKAFSACAAVCFTNGRINFWTPNGGGVVLPTQGQAFFYFGDDLKRFAAAFASIGFIAIPY